MLIVVNDPFGHCDLDLGGLSLASLMLAFLATTCNPLDHSPHVDYRLPLPPSWLQLLTTLLVIMVMILLVQVLHLLC